MQADIMRGFSKELEKHAISLGRTLAALRRRVAQGARVAPEILQDMEQQAAAGARTSRMDRRLALNAADDVRATQRMNKMLSHPMVQQTHNRLRQGWEQAAQVQPGVHDFTKRLPSHYDHGPSPVQFGYSRAHIDKMTGGSKLVDPRGLMGRAPNPATAPTVLATRAGNTAVTAVTAVTPMRQRALAPVAAGTTAGTPRGVLARNLMATAPTIPAPAMATGAP